MPANADKARDQFRSDLANVIHPCIELNSVENAIEKIIVPLAEVSGHLAGLPNLLTLGTAIFLDNRKQYTIERYSKWKVGDQMIRDSRKTELTLPDATLLRKIFRFSGPLNVANARALVRDVGPWKK